MYKRPRQHLQQEVEARKQHIGNDIEPQEDDELVEPAVCQATEQGGVKSDDTNHRQPRVHVIEEKGNWKWILTEGNEV